MNLGTPSGQRWRPCFPARCPMCAQDTMFHLLVKFAGFEGVVVGVVCAKCNYEVLAGDADEREKLTQASRLWEQQESGELDANSFAAALEELDSTTLAKIIADARTWPCPTCQHENPLHFVTCWNCGYERPLTGEEQALEQVEPTNGDDTDSADG